ncbi:MAG TPA: ABC transporter permease [Pirellulales bacterium]|nr:ABC transporter permease [Pirellulales bacterium]
MQLIEQLPVEGFGNTNGALQTESPRSHRLIIKPTSGWRAIDFRELWRYRELLYFLVWRDVKVRYKQTVLGALWAIIQPVMSMVVFSTFFGRFGGMSKNVDVPYPIFVFSGLLLWQFFSSSVTQAGGSLVSASTLLTKVYFPRLFYPLSNIGSGLVDLFVASSVLIVLMVKYGVAFTSGLAMLPLFVLGTAILALGVGSLLAALSVVYRDFRYVIPFIVQLWMFASPVAYPLSVVPQKYQLIYALNPAVGWLTGFRSAILGDAVRWDCVGVSLIVTIVVVVVGVLYFRRVERRFADVI